MKPRFFRRQADFHRWLETNHDKAPELWVGYYKTGSGKPSMTWPESVDEALCFGWIDGIRKSIDEVSYTIRFTRRKPGSVWSAVNITRAEELRAQGLVQPAGLRAFEARKENRSGIYSYENRPRTLDGPYAKSMKANLAAWTFFQAQAPSYRRAATWWVLSAKKEDTRLSRLERLIDDSANGRTLPWYRWKPKAGGRPTPG